MIKSIFKCMRCAYSWSLNKPAMVTCPRCKNIYVEWLNASVVVDWLRKQG